MNRVPTTTIHNSAKLNRYKPCWVKLEPLTFLWTLPTMPSHTVPADNGKYDLLITITLEDCRVTARENYGQDGGGELIWSETYEFDTESEAQACYEAQIRKWDPQYFPRLEARARAVANAVPVYLEFHDGKSHKFYEVTVIESTVLVRYGRVGTEGQTFSDDYVSPEQAQTAADKKLNEKLKKGYRRPNSPVPAPAAAPAVVPPAAVIEGKRLSTEIEALLAYFEPGVVQRFPPATAEMIANAEQMLGTQFPPSLRSLLQVTNGLKVPEWMDLLGVPDIGAIPQGTIVDWSLCYRADGNSSLIVLIQNSSGNPFCLVGDQRNDRGECAVTKVNHETRESRGVIASSLDRLLWFELSTMQSYLRPDGEFKDDDELEESEFDDEWSWYDDPDYCLQHDPDIATFC